MTQTAHEEVQHAIYNLLTVSNAPEPGLAALNVVGVFDFRGVPQNQPFDYITLGDATELPQNTLGRRGYLLSMMLHIWSRQGGTQQGSNILSRLNKLLDQPTQPLTLASQEHVYTMYNGAHWLADPDGLTLHIAAKYQIYTEE